MSRLEITAPDKAQLVIEGLYKDLERIGGGSFGSLQ